MSNEHHRHISLDALIEFLKNDAPPKRRAVRKTQPRLPSELNKDALRVQRTIKTIRRADDLRRDATGLVASINPAHREILKDKIDTLLSLAKPGQAVPSTPTQETIVPQSLSNFAAMPPAPVPKAAQPSLSLEEYQDDPNSLF